MKRDIIKALHQVPLFSSLTNEKIQWIASQGNQIILQQGVVFIREGEPVKHFFVLLEGELEITTNEIGDHNIHVINFTPGAFFGSELFLLDLPTFLATGRAVQDSHLFRLEKNIFWDVLTECLSIISEVLRAAARLWQNYEEVLLHHAKLQAINTLSSGLAHELNNPAASVSRNSVQLEELFLKLPSFALKLNQLNLTQPQLIFINEWLMELKAKLKTNKFLDPLTQSMKEEEVAYWLEKNNILNGWRLAPTTYH